jgi:hypothetical protein
VKTRACCGAVEWRSQASDVLSFSREARLSAPTDAQAKKSRNYVIPALRVRGSRLAIHATVCRAAGDLEAWRNKILTIFAPYTFSRSQGQIQTQPDSSVNVGFGPKTGRKLAIDPCGSEFYEVPA